MKKVYLLITAICLSALTGCIKENVELTQANVSMSISTRAELSSSTEQGDAIGDINVWAFACDANGNVSESGQTAVAWRRISAANTHTSVDVHLQFATCNDEQDHYYKLVAVINEGEFGEVSGIESFGRETTYNQLANATFVANDLMAKTPGNGPNSTPGQMPISHWKIITLNKDNNGSIHPDNCVEVSMPVYRAVAKTQLFVAKTDASTNLVIKNVTIGSSAFPIQGALLSAAEGTTNDNTAGDFKGDGATTPMWYINSVATSTDKTETIFSSTAGQSVTKVLSKDAHASAEMGNFDYVTSHFLYENKGGSTVWNTDSTDGGYYMDVTYNVGSGDKTERVWLPAVVRNHDYQVRALIYGTAEVKFKVAVAPWVTVDNDLEI